jgi:hypothetical protein
MTIKQIAFSDAAIVLIMTETIRRMIGASNYRSKLHGDHRNIRVKDASAILARFIKECPMHGSSSWMPSPV